MTSYAKSILTLASQANQHFTAEEIFLLLKKEHPKVVLATVYNNLKTLCDDNLIRRISVEGQPDRFDRTVRHDHLVCTLCGKLSDITLHDLTDSLRKQTGLKEISYDLKIHYLCPECRKANHTSQSLGGSSSSFDNKK